MMRELEIENDLISLDELSNIIRLTFGLPLSAVDKGQFDKMIIQISNTLKSDLMIPFQGVFRSFF